MRQHQLKPPAGATHSRKRLGRGGASGQGTTAGRGTKGQKARAGGGVRPGFEGGQLPIIKRLPHMRGFTNIFKIYYAAVNVEQLNRFDANEEITPAKLASVGLIPKSNVPVKLLGNGDLTKQLIIKVNKVSASAKAKVEAAGGKVEGLARA
jgi:large subunit ribosomal protein L15